MSHYIYRLFINFLLIHYFIYRLVRWSDPPYTYDSAIRVSELRGLTTESLKLNETIPYIRVHGKGDKERIVSITDKTAEHLKRYLCRFHSEMDSKCPCFIQLSDARI